ncbi:cytochrome P450 [Amycolatopsis pigmentata]|uniref:Cytochrome P450 n=1 Tax=Amycolatopsis pigmentata TaxID=450801 RepID=A0ABW5G2Q1_9PSEU
MTSPSLPVTRRCPYAPPEEHVAIRETEGISRFTMPAGQEVWVLSRMADVRAMLTDQRFSSDRRHPNFPFTGKARGAPGSADGIRPTLIMMDPPQHGAARRAVVPEFTVRRVAALRPRIQAIVDELIDALLAGPRPADLVKDLALAVPSLVICEVLGVPYADHEFFQTRTMGMVSRTVPPEDRRRYGDEVRQYLRDRVNEKRENPTDDLLGRQLAQGAEPEDVVTLAFGLLVAGHETTANMISLGILALLEHPELRTALRARPELMPAAVEELLRVLTVAEFTTARVASTDIEFRGVTIRAGEGVLGLSNSANHDPAAFRDPDEIRIDRNARHHIAFGYGPHQCLGQHLARTELQVVFGTLLRRVPGLRLAVPADQVPVKHDSTIYGLYELQVTWDET